MSALVISWRSKNCAYLQSQYFIICVPMVTDVDRISKLVVIILVSTLVGPETIQFVAKETD
jgi:hypothetical protein